MGRLCPFTTLSWQLHAAYLHQMGSIYGPVNTKQCHGNFSSSRRRQFPMSPVMDRFMKAAYISDWSCS